MTRWPPIGIEAASKRVIICAHAGVETSNVAIVMTGQGERQPAADQVREYRAETSRLVHGSRRRIIRVYVEFGRLVTGVCEGGETLSEGGGRKSLSSVQRIQEDVTEERGAPVLAEYTCSHDSTIRDNFPASFLDDRTEVPSEYRRAKLRTPRLANDRPLAPTENSAELLGRAGYGSRD